MSISVCERSLVLGHFVEMRLLCRHAHPHLSSVQPAARISGGLATGPHGARAPGPRTPGGPQIMKKQNYKT